MQFRGLLAGAVLLALLGGLLYWSNQKEKEPAKPDPNAPPKIVEIPSDQIQQVEIVKAGAATTVKRGNDGKWEIIAPKPSRADQDSVSTLVGAFNSLGSDRLIEEKAADLTQYGLQQPQVAVTVTKKDGKTVKLLLGDETPTSGGIFAKLEGDPRVFTVASWNKSSLDKGFKDLQDRRLITFDSDKLTRIEVTLKGQMVEFGKNNQNEWTILKPKPMRADGGAVEELVRRLKDAKMDPAVSDEDARKALTEFAGGALIAVAKTTDASGTQELQVRKGKDNNYYARGAALEGVYKVPNDLGDGLNKAVDDFRQKKVFDFGWSDPNRIEIDDAGKVRTFAKSGDKWTEGAKTLDNISVQNLVDKLRDLQAAKFLDAGYTTPVLKATVVSNDGKRTEKVLISKTGEDYFAIRENEPSVYQLDRKAVEDLKKAAAEVKEPAPPSAAKKDEKKK
ncbi:MAG: DUF4340 domain-containing protein [Bryobacterales bacterium]|nr:DUF4340 domain-containing protein [Bryobacterales bacterium]